MKRYHFGCLSRRGDRVAVGSPVAPQGVGDAPGGQGAANLNGPTTCMLRAQLDRQERIYIGAAFLGGRLKIAAEDEIYRLKAEIAKATSGDPLMDKEPYDGNEWGSTEADYYRTDSSELPFACVMHWANGRYDEPHFYASESEMRHDAELRAEEDYLDSFCG